jgi:TP901 family phage tail tape measure protein
MADRTVRVRLEAAVDGFNRSMRSAKGEVTSFSTDLRSSVRNNAQELQTLGVAAGAMGLAAAAGIKSVLTSGAEFQGSMNQVRAVTGATGATFDEMSGQARELGASTKFSAGEAADAMYFLASAGFSTSETMSALPGVLQLAAAGNMDLATTADIASNVLAGYGMEVGELGRVNDVLAATFQSTNTNISQLGEAMKYVAPVASEAGIEFEEAAAALGLLGNAGIQGSMAGTTLRGIITGLIAPTGEAADTLEALGINALDSSGKLLPMADILDQLAASGISGAEIFQIFGERAGPGLQVLLREGGDALRDLTDNGLNSAGTAAEVAAIQMEGLQGAVTELGSAWEGLKIALFEAGAGDFAEGLVRNVTSVVQALEAMPPAAQNAVMIGGGVTAVVGGIGGAALIAAPRIVATADAIAKLGGISGMASSGLSGLLKFGLHPVTIALGLAAAAVGIWAGSKARAADRVRELTEAVTLDTYEIGENTRKIVANRLETEGLLEAAQRLGIDLGTVTEAAMGNGAAMAVVEAAVARTRGEWEAAVDTGAGVSREMYGQRDAADELESGLGRLVPELETATAESRRLAEASGDLDPNMRYVAAATELTADQYRAYRGLAAEAADATDTFGTALEGVEGAADDTRTELEKLSDAIDRVTGATMGAERANLRMLDGWRTLEEQLLSTTEVRNDEGEVIDTVTASLDENTEAGSKNRQAILNQMDAVLDSVQADYERDGSISQLISKYGEQIDKMREVGRRFGLTEAQVDDYLETLGLTPEQVLTQVVAETGAAQSAVERFIRATGQIPRFTHTTVNVAVNDKALRDVNARIARSGGTVRVQHAGGWAGTGPMRPNYAPLGHDEIPAVLKSGEFVVRDDVAQRYGPLLEQLNARKFHDGGWVGKDQPLATAPMGTAPPAASQAAPSQVTHLNISQIIGAGTRDTLGEAFHQARLFAARRK